MKANVPTLRLVKTAAETALEPSVQAALTLLTADLQRHLTMEELAAAANLCPHHLVRLFKAATGFTCTQYVRRVRLEQARELLLDPLLSVKEIRLQVGCEDASHFSKDFKRAFGVTPLAYRKNILRGRQHVQFRQ